jgi:hypothetical protein
MSRNYRFEYLERTTVNGDRCDSRRVLDKELSRRNGYPLDVDMTVCINPVSHRVLEIKLDSLSLRFFDFDQEIVIQEPVLQAKESGRPQDSVLPSGPK